MQLLFEAFAIFLHFLLLYHAKELSAGAGILGVKRHAPREEIWGTADPGPAETCGPSLFLFFSDHPAAGLSQLGFCQLS